MSHRFFCIHDGCYAGIQDRLDSIKRACDQLDVEFVDLDASKIDYSVIPDPRRGDMMYNVARGGEILESILLTDQLRTFYINQPALIENNGDTTKYSLLHNKCKISAPKTIFSINKDRKLLHSAVDYLNSFPLIIKTAGGSKGEGVMVVNGYPGLFSLVDYLIAKGENFILREYIEPKEIARLIVVGNEVVAANSKLIPDDDFRSCVHDNLPIPKKYSESIESLAIRASHLANFENCGVDILIDENDKGYVLEVNMPHDFVTTEQATGIDISSKMVRHLLAKSQTISLLA